jgi:hypothetical protein
MIRIFINPKKGAKLMIFDKVCKMMEGIRDGKITVTTHGGTLVQPFSHPMWIDSLEAAKLFLFDVDEIIADVSQIPMEEYITTVRHADDHRLPYDYSFFNFNFSNGRDVAIFLWEDGMDDYYRIVVAFQHSKDLVIWAFGKIRKTIQSIDDNDWLYGLEMTVATIIDFSDKTATIVPYDKSIESEYEIFEIRDVVYTTVSKLSPALMYLNQPKKFIFEFHPTNMKPSKKKIARSDRRKTYTVLRPNEIRKIMRTHAESGRTVTGHDRRGHWRHFNSERFINNRGSRKWIDAVWVGPKEAVIGNKKYRVVLDK